MLLYISTGDRVVCNNTKRKTTTQSINPKTKLEWLVWLTVLLLFHVVCEIAQQQQLAHRKITHLNKLQILILIGFVFEAMKIICKCYDGPEILHLRCCWWYSCG